MSRASTCPWPTTTCSTWANRFQRAAVEIRHFCQDPQFLTPSNADYYPENPVGDGVAAQPGSLAFRSDHKPVGTPLRVQFYR